MGRRVRVTGDLFHGRVPAGAVYIGRGAPGLARSPFANPFTGKRYTREESLARYAAWLAERPGLVERARREIGDADVACWCRLDLACHGDLLLSAIAPVVDGLIWWSAPSATVGLVVAAGRVVDCPPYAARWALGADARALWRRGARTPGVTLAWLPTPPARSGGGAATSATSATGQVTTGFSCRGRDATAATSATNPRHHHTTDHAAQPLRKEEGR